MKKTIILFLLFIRVFLFSGEQSSNITSIKPGIKDIILGKSLKDIADLMNKTYQITLENDDEEIFSNELSMKFFIKKYAPAIMSLRDIREWEYDNFKKLIEKEPYNKFLEVADRNKWLNSEYPLKFKRWKRYSVMLKNFNPFVRKVELAFYRDILYYARFYIKDKYSFYDTYLPENQERFLMHLYLTYKIKYGQPVLFNNYEYKWRDNNVELSLDGNASTITFVDYKTSELLVRYLKNISIILSRIQIEIEKKSDYIEHYLKDF